VLGGIRTHNLRCLRPAPLPIGLQAHEDAGFAKAVVGHASGFICPQQQERDVTRTAPASFEWLTGFEPVTPTLAR
jgi:hypothetical protein